jgi:hypothetical protein
MLLNSVAGWLIQTEEVARERGSPPPLAPSLNCQSRYGVIEFLQNLRGTSAATAARDFGGALRQRWPSLKKRSADDDAI